MRRVYWDTMLFAYWLEGKSQFAPRVGEILQSMALRQDILCSSLFTLAELLVHPTKQNDTDGLAALKEFFLSPDLTLLEFAPEAATTFAALRAKHGLKPIDAFHLAIAAASGVDVFVTNDRRLHSVRQDGLPLIASLETDIF